ncbi:MAG: hypothetical protein JWM57_3755 [Phycisphaerales bacterium]|nr:hypothetical protein [Phycisphaerales bacterium]
MKLSFFAAAAILAGSVGIAVAHDGPRVWINTAGGQISTWDGPYPPNSNASLYHADRVFSFDMADTIYDDDGVDWQTSFPGFQRLPSGAAISSGTRFSYDVVAEPLWYVPGAGGSAGTFKSLSQQFGSSGTPRFVITNEIGENRFTSTGFVSGSAAFQYNAEGSHGHLTYSLQGLDGGTNYGGVDGIYALELQLTAPGLATSLPYYLVLGKNADPTQLATAEAVLEGTLVPEPTMLALFSASAIGLLARRRNAAA